MPVATLTDGRKAWQRRTTRRQLAIWLAWLACVAVFTFCWQLISERTIWLFVTDAPTAAADLGERMLPPNFAYMNQLWGAIWDTLNIATLGTVLADRKSVVSGKSVSVSVDLGGGSIIKKKNNKHN